MAERNRSLKDLTRFSTEVIDAEGLQAELRGSSDRSLALVTAAHVDVSLQKILQRVMNIDSPAAMEELCKDGGPLGSLSSKIMFAHATGTISDAQRKCLDAVRKVRNVFAHTIYHVDFSEPAISDICLSLLDHSWVKKHIDGGGGSPSWHKSKNTFFAAAIVTMTNIFESEAAKKLALRIEERSEALFLWKVYKGVTSNRNWLTPEVHELSERSELMSFIGDPRFWFYNMDRGK